MSGKSAEHLIPQQEEGASTNTESSVDVSATEADHFFSIVKQRLLNVNQWHEYSGTGSATFCLLDEKGNFIKRNASKGDYFEIDIPGPGGEKDYVQIEDIAELNNKEEQSLIIKVRPSPNPKNRSSDTDHFFSESATSSFMVKRKGNRITAGVYGRNEKPNIDASSTIDKIRNTIVATGAALGFSKIQWKSLVNGLLKK